MAGRGWPGGRRQRHGLHRPALAGDWWAVPRAVAVVGGRAALVGCGSALVMGLSLGWAPGKLLGYAGLALVYLVLTLAFNLMQTMAPGRRRHRAYYFLVHARAGRAGGGAAPGRPTGCRPGRAARLPGPAGAA